MSRPWPEYCPLCGLVLTPDQQRAKQCPECDRANPPVTIAQKVEHVRTASNPGGHTCHWPRCGKEVKPAYWGCPQHWYRLPPGLRSKIWRTYSPGQEIAKTPSPEYLEAAREVEIWIAGYLQHNPERPHA